jgi:hypothetical protein
VSDQDERDAAATGEDVEGHQFSSDERSAAATGEDEVEGHAFDVGENKIEAE